MARAPSTFRQADVTAAVYTPAMLATEWQCSERHIRNLIARGELRAFRLGGKLVRIPFDAVEEFLQCNRTDFNDCTVSSASSTPMETESGTVTALAPLTRAKLNALRQRSTQS
jgi:excisionase family DNA binding protein